MDRRKVVLMKLVSNITNTPNAQISSAKSSVRSCSIQNSQDIKATASFGASNKTYVVGEGFKKAAEWIGQRSTPFNRFLLGATAVAIQPFIDLHNNDVDEKTRQVSWARAIAKAVAGTTSGIIVRFACIKSIKALTDTTVKPQNMKNNWKTALIPELIDYEKYAKDLRLLNKHRQTIGSIIALGVMLFTNFAFDVPVTKFLTNKIVEKKLTPDKKQKEQGGIK